MARLGKTVCMGMTLLSGGVSAWANAPASEAFLYGAWARSQAGCARPELKFSKGNMNIAIDADGEPVSFAYPDVRYQLNGRQALIKLGSRHPYSKTADKEALQFKLIDDNTIALQKTKGVDTRFLRCAK